MRRSRLIAAIAGGLVLLGAAVGLTACSSDSDVASRNISTESEQFRVERKVVFYNGVTDKVIAEVTGRCSVDTAEGVPGRSLAVTCKIGKNKYIKNYLGLSDNTTWFVLQQKTVDVSVYHYEFILKPENIVPDVRGEAGTQ